MMVQGLLPSESMKRLKALPKPITLSKRIVQVYISSLPSSSEKYAAMELEKYCVVLGLLMRSWMVCTKAKERFVGLVDAVEDVIQMRQKRLETLKGPVRMSVAKVLNREGQILQQLAIKLEDSRR
jgi:hypothetical protein